MAYRAFGLVLESFVPLPELERSSSHPAIQIRRGTTADLPPVSVAGGPLVIVGDHEILLHCPGVGTFHIIDGKEIVVDAVPGAEVAAIRLLLLGPAIALLLHQRGALVLHASAIGYAGAVVGFAGGSGAGKSTLAAALHLRGHPFFSDDLIVIDPSADPVAAWPAFPQSKLWPDTVIALGLTPARLDTIRRGSEKRVRPMTPDHSRSRSRSPLPLRCLYVLERGDALWVEPLAPAAAMIELVRHSYAPRSLHPTSGPGRFVALGRVARGIPVRRLRYQASLTKLPEVVRAVESDLDSLLAGGVRS